MDTKTVVKLEKILVVHSLPCKGSDDPAKEANKVTAKS